VKPTTISADVLFEAFRSYLHWEWVAGLGASERRFDEVAVRAARSGADLVGYLNYIHPYRVQILGEREIAYLTNSTAVTFSFPAQVFIGFALRPRSSVALILALLAALVHLGSLIALLGR
jgi:hypothetical protein